MKKFFLSTSLMLIFSIFALSLQAQTAAQNPVKEKAKTEQTSDTNLDKVGCGQNHSADHKCTGDHKAKDGKACAEKAGDKKCCSDKKADAKTAKHSDCKDTKKHADCKETATTKKACCSDKK